MVPSYCKHSLDPYFFGSSCNLDSSWWNKIDLRICMNSRGCASTNSFPPPALECQFFLFLYILMVPSHFGHSLIPYDFRSSWHLDSLWWNKVGGRMCNNSLVAPVVVSSLPPLCSVSFFYFIYINGNKYTWELLNTYFLLCNFFIPISSDFSHTASFYF